MRKPRPIFALLCAYAVLSACAAAVHASSTPNAHASDDAAIRAVCQKYESAWNAHDAQAFSQIFAPDAEFTNVRGITSLGPAGIAKAHAPLFSGMFRQSHQQTKSIRIRYLSPDIATVEVRWNMTGALDYTGQPRPPADGLRDIVMIRRHGLWRIVDFHNMELPPMKARIPAPAAQ